MFEHLKCHMTQHTEVASTATFETLSQNKPLIKSVLIALSEFIVQHARADGILKGHESVHIAFLFFKLTNEHIKQTNSTSILSPGEVLLLLHSFKADKPSHNRHFMSTVI